MKIGVGITTYNHEEYFEALYDSLPIKEIDTLVVVNGGEKYKGSYDCNWIQHNTNCKPSMCRNDCLRFMQERDMDYYFIIEDDMIIKDSTIFERYVEACEISRLGYLCFVSTSWESGSPGSRTPKAIIKYNKDIAISLYPHMCNEFTCKSRECLRDTGLYDTSFNHMFDVDNVYTISKSNYAPGFWWFPDIKDSDDLIMNNPEAASRLQAGGKRERELPNDCALFHRKHNTALGNIQPATLDQITAKLKAIK